MKATVSARGERDVIEMGEREVTVMAERVVLLTVAERKWRFLGRGDAPLG